MLGTTIVSELRTGPHGAVVDDAQLLLSSLNQSDIQAGIELTREQDAAEALEIEIWLELLTHAYKVLPLDAMSFRHWALLMHRKSNTLYEVAMIAATAKTHYLTELNPNVINFKALGLDAFEPFNTPPL